MNEQLSTQIHTHKSKLKKFHEKYLNSLVKFLLCNQALILRVNHVHEAQDS